MCAGSSKLEHSAFQPKDGGSIPTSALQFKIGRFQEAKELILKYHYSHRCPCGAQLVVTAHRQDGEVGLFDTELGPAVAAIIFSTPPTRWSFPVWELARLVRKDDLVYPLTKLISIGCKLAKKQGANLLVSFADSQQGHHGGVYQAAGWNYHEKRSSRMDGLIVDGIFIPGRTCNAKWGTSSPRLLKEQHGELNIEPHWDEGKHLYWRSLTKEGDSGANQLGLQKNPYPKPNLTNLTSRAL